MKIKILMAALASCLMATAAPNLEFDDTTFTVDTLTMPDGAQVVYKSYTNLPYVANPDDPRFQTMNVFVPVVTRPGQVPILLRTYIGGYMGTEAMTPSPTDATGRALKEGFVVCIPGSRGSNSVITVDGKDRYIGTAPNGLVDLKAAIRYLRHNKDRIVGNTDLIFIDGTSAGGAMSALVGTTANSPLYEPLLEQIGAAKERDDVYGAICFCPITDLNHADMEYEWLYGCTNDGVRHLDDEQKAISDQLAALCPEYLNSLNLYRPDGAPITADNYRDYLKSFLIESAHVALENGCVIPDTIGITLYQSKPNLPMGGPMGGPRLNNPGMRGAPSFGPGRMPRFNNQTDFVADIDLDKYLTYVATCQQLKTPPAFDAMGVITPNATPENRVFGNEEGQPANFTDFSLQHRLKDPNAQLSDQMRQRVLMMNPMDFIGNDMGTTAPHWYIRHGAKDRDTSFLVPINLATKLRNAGLDVDFHIAWNRPHSGDYNLDSVFAWIASVLPADCCCKCADQQ